MCDTKSKTGRAPVFQFVATFSSGAALDTDLFTSTGLASLPPYRQLQPLHMYQPTILLGRTNELCRLPRDTSTNTFRRTLCSSAYFLPDRTTDNAFVIHFHPFRLFVASSDLREHFCCESQLKILYAFGIGITSNTFVHPRVCSNFIIKLFQILDVLSPGYARSMQTFRLLLFLNSSHREAGIPPPMVTCSSVYPSSIVQRALCIRSYVVLDAFVFFAKHATTFPEMSGNSSKCRSRKARVRGHV